MTIDWMNSSDDIIEARRIGFEEGVASKLATNDDLQAENERLRGELREIGNALSPGIPEASQCLPLACARSVMDDLDAALRAQQQAEAACGAMQTLLRRIHDTSDARFATYTDREAAYLAGKRWDKLVDELQDLVRPLAFGPNPGQGLLERLERAEYTVARLLPQGDGYLIVTYKHGYAGDCNLMWRPRSSGYTAILSKAGVYTEAEAHAIVDGQDDKLMVPVAVAARLAVAVLNAEVGASRKELEAAIAAHPAAAPCPRGAGDCPVGDDSQRPGPVSAVVTDAAGSEEPTP